MLIEGSRQTVALSVSFRYPVLAEVSLAPLESIAVPDKRLHNTVLRDVSFEVCPGQLVALVGRLHDVQSGSVRINGIDVRDARLDSLRERIGVVTQDAHLFHDTRTELLAEEGIYADLGQRQFSTPEVALP